MGDELGSDHFIINGVFSYTPIYNKTNEKTVRLFHKADWIDINFAIRTTMTKTTLNKMTITEDEIDNYVDTPTNTITRAIAEKVPIKSIKRNSIGLPTEIRELIRQKRHQMRLWQRTRIPQYKTNANRLQKRISKDITIRKRVSWKMYCDDMELSEGQDAAWYKIRSVLKTDVDADLEQSIGQSKAKLPEGHTLGPDIHPCRIRFGEVTDALEKVNPRKANGPDHITNKIIRYLLPTLHIIF